MNFIQLYKKQLICSKEFRFILLNITSLYNMNNVVSRKQLYLIF